MKLVLIALGLLATTGVVYAACVFCREIGRTKGRLGFDRAFSLTDFVSSLDGVLARSWPPPSRQS
jgi:hypothetical protein